MSLDLTDARTHIGHFVDHYSPASQYAFCLGEC